MTLIRIAAIAVAGMIVATAPGSAGPLSLAGPQLVKPDSQVVQIRYRHRHYGASPGAVIGGMLGIVGGLAGGGCYFNDCEYNYGGGYGGGGYGGGYGYGGGGHGGGGHGGGGHGHGGGGGHGGGHR